MRGKALSILVGALLASACTATPAAPQPAPSSSPSAAETALADYLDGLAERQEFRGSVQVRRGDQVLLNRGYDMADTATGVANGPDTRFRIGSLTKQFTALAVLKLQEQGKLRTSDPVCRHLPRCPQAWAPITIEHLLTHTAGLFNTVDLTEAEAAALAAKLGRPTPEQWADELADRPLDFPPGSQWKYNNSGYVLLGYVIELVSGQDYGTFVRQQILDPLGMKDSGYPRDPADRHVIATGYEDWSTTSVPFEPALTYSAGALYSTVNDLARWNRFLLTADPPVVSKDTLAQLLRPRVQVPVPVRCTASSTVQTCAYGYGIYVGGTPDNPIYFHTGRFSGFLARIEIHPSTGLSVTILSNLYTTGIDTTSQYLFRLAG